MATRCSSPSRRRRPPRAPGDAPNPRSVPPPPLELGGSACSTTIAYLSHVLRTPVTSLMAAVANLQDAQVAELCPAAAPSLAVCRRNVERLRSTIERIEELVALEAHAPLLRAAPVDCAELVRKIRRWMERLRSDEVKRLHVEVPWPDAVAVTDGARLAQLLAQFLGASVALADPGMLLPARLELLESQADGRRLRCTVRGLGSERAQGLMPPGAGSERVAALDRLLRLELSHALLRGFDGRVRWSLVGTRWEATLDVAADLRPATPRRG